MKNKIIVIIISLAIFVGIDVAFNLTQGGEWWANIPAFFALLGGLGSLSIIIVATLLGRYWLSRDEDYYESGGSDD